MQSFDSEESARFPWPVFLAGASLGAALMYLVDPTGGRRRRRLIRDQMSRAAHTTADGFEGASRDIANRAYGTWAAARSWRDSRQVPEEILVERVRAALGRHVANPHAIDVEAANGCVTLRGQILTHEVPGLVRAIQKVGGVSRVDDQLEQHDEPGSIPSLQGGARESRQTP